MIFASFHQGKEEIIFAFAFAFLFHPERRETKRGNLR